MKKPLRQKKSLNKCEEIPSPFQIIQTFYIGILAGSHIIKMEI